MTAEDRKRNLALLYIASTNGTDKAGATDMVHAMIAQRPVLVAAPLPQTVRELHDEAEENVQWLLRRYLQVDPYRARCMTVDLVDRRGCRT